MATEIPICIKTNCSNQASFNIYYPDSEGGQFWTMCDDCFNEQDGQNYIQITYKDALNLLEETDTINTIWIKDFSDDVEYYALDCPDTLKLIKEETLEDEWSEYTFYK